jgi:hypothetical protein
MINGSNDHATARAAAFLARTAVAPAVHSTLPGIKPLYVGYSARPGRLPHEFRRRGVLSSRMVVCRRG